ncbi:hypothetical protein PR002_g29200 [Phytophthora rubi]|uniref:Uncharacterized protein n=1 Tax=Phytophthora rubi TaxID=129364 RepID=A0A6A3H316_9STRA|nr:hypothetical protein PR002_g29200 [Phytophthora rubi]
MPLQILLCCQLSNAWSGQSIPPPSIKCCGMIIGQNKTTVKENLSHLSVKVR